MCSLVNGCLDYAPICGTREKPFMGIGWKQIGSRLHWSEAQFTSDLLLPLSRGHSEAATSRRSKGSI